MDFHFDEAQEGLRETARAFLQEVSDSEAVRRAMSGELGHDPGVWKQLAGELGWTSVHVPEDHGGLGLGMVELAALLERCGEALLCSPFFATAGLATPALLAAGDGAQQARWLPALALGECRATLALLEAGGSWEPAAVETTWSRRGDEIVLRGDKRHVVDGHYADLLVVAARAEGSHGEEGLALVAVPGDARGLARERLPTLDQTRCLARVALDGVALPASALLGGGEDGAAALRTTLRHAAVALAAEQVGGAQRCLDLAVDYARERVQFGRPIGSFQAIKHKCADGMVQVESARSAAYYAACAAAEASDELAAVASLAKATASEAYFRSAADCLQIHGGVGFTWEYDVHLHLKRAKSGETLLGEPSYHRELVAREMGL